MTRVPLVLRAELVRLMLWSCDRAGEARAVPSFEDVLSAYTPSDVLPAVPHESTPPDFRKAAPGGAVVHRPRLTAFVHRGDATLRTWVTALARTYLSIKRWPAASS